MPLHERWTVLVEIDRRWSDRVLRIEGIGILAAAVKKIRAPVHLFHGLQQELHDFRMKIATDQNLGFGSNKLHIILRAAWYRQTDRARCCAALSFRNLGKGKAIACGNNEFYELPLTVLLFIYRRSVPYS